METRRVLPFVLAVLMLSTTFVGPSVGLSGDDAEASTSSGDSGEPHVTVAYIDSGINPYHVEFREEAFEGQAPGSYIPDFPNDATEFDLALEKSTYDEAKQADEAEWEDVSYGELVTFPGTKIVGAISFETYRIFSVGDTSLDNPDPPLRILDPELRGHGTMVASRLAANNISLGGPEIRLVVVQASPADDQMASAEKGLQWLAEQDWIDVVANSWNLASPAGPAGGTYTSWTDDIHALAERKPTFFLTGNGPANAGVVGYPSQTHGTLPPGAVPVGAEDNGDLVRWSNQFPALVADGHANPSVDHLEMRGVHNDGGGTSAATPFTAGGAAEVLLEARKMFNDTGGVRDNGVLAVAQQDAEIPSSGPLADGTFTIEELKQVLFHTAVVPEENPSDGDRDSASIPVPFKHENRAATYPFWGYGEVNANSVDTALDVIHGDVQEPARPTADRLYETDQEARRLIYGPLLNS